VLFALAKEYNEETTLNMNFRMKIFFPVFFLPKQKPR